MPDRDRAVRLLIADDSATVRSLIRAMLAPEKDVVIAGEAADGKEAVLLAQKLRPNVVLMDINMPVMDGLEATERIMAACPVPIVAFSSMTRDAEALASIGMLAAGALDVMPKPDFGSDGALTECARRLSRKIRIASGVAVVRRPRGRIPAPGRFPAVPAGSPERPFAVLGIGASTGGPAALRDLLSRLPASFPLPVLAVQHITAGFTSGFVDWLQQFTPLRVRMALREDRLTPGTVLFAPEGRQMEALEDGRILAQSRKRKGVHLPSVDVLFASMAKSFGAKAAGILLTGMGNDGVEGLLEIRRAGGVTIAQDEESSTVFGMPKEAIRQGAAETVLPPAEMASFLMMLLLARPGRPGRSREGTGV